MNKIAHALTLLAIGFFVCPTLGQADIVYVKNEDKLVGTLQSPAFSILTPYGKVRIETEFLKSISFKEGTTGQWIVKTINNDQFSGSLLTDSIDFLQDDGQERKIAKSKIKRIWRETSGPSQRSTTTIITMKNNDRFSGRLVVTVLEIHANFMTKSIRHKDINRINFKETYQQETEILLENGDLITGALKQNLFLLALDSVSELTVARNKVKSIQFNAPKMIIKTFYDSLKAKADSDGDGIPDYADICMDTPAGAKVAMDGCTRDSDVAQAKDRNKIIGYQKSPTAQPKKILFDFDRAELKPQYYLVLDEAAAMLSRSPQTKAEIHGHTDNVGTKKYNQSLSEKRARAVKQYLVQKGATEERLVTKGFGYTKNAATNASKAGRAINRRVEILLMPEQSRLAYHDRN